MTLQLLAADPVWDIDPRSEGQDEQDLSFTDGNELRVNELPSVHLLSQQRVRIGNAQRLRQGLTCVSGDERLGRLTKSDEAVFRGHKTSLAGYGADRLSAPIASTEAATSVVGDNVRDGSDIPPEALDTSVEDSTATGAAATSQRPHPNPSTESGSVQR